MFRYGPLAVRGAYLSMRRTLRYFVEEVLGDGSFYCELELFSVVGLGAEGGVDAQLAGLGVGGVFRFDEEEPDACEGFGAVEDAIHKVIAASWDDKDARNYHEAANAAKEENHQDVGNPHGVAVVSHVRVHPEEAT